MKPRRPVGETGPEPKANHHAPLSALRLHATDGTSSGDAEIYNPPDEIETMCVMCTAEWRGGQWRHDRSCILAAL